MIFADTTARTALADAGDPLIWTSSAVRAEFNRILAVLDIINNDVSAASGAGKITSAEWTAWHAVYLDGHNFLTTASTLWGSNVAVARQHEQEANKWRTLVASRGQQVQGPANLVHQPDPPASGVSYWTIALVVGGAAAAFVAYSKIKKLL